MAIPALATVDKSFICSYVIGSDIDHRKALGVINEITTFTNEYIDGFCWIPVNAGALNDQSWFWDAPEKDVVYVKVGVRVSADGYLHAWLTSSQKVSELILWYTNYNTQHYAVDDKTTLHWCIEKMYQVIFGNTTSFVLANIKFQKYVGAGSTRLYLFGSYSNSLLDNLTYSIDHPSNVQKSSWSWYPNNSTTILSDYLFSSLHTWSKGCTKADIDSDGWVDFGSAFGKSPEHDDPLFYWHEIGVAGSVNIPSVCNPIDPTEKTFDYCHITFELSGFATGNNSGRSYPLYEGFPAAACTGKGYTDCGVSVSEQKLRIDYAGNRAYIEDPPGTYSCDPAFTYDSSASFTTGQWRSISANEIDYASGMAKFSGHGAGTHFLAVYWTGGIFDDFLEWTGSALDELRHDNFVIALAGVKTNKMLSIWTKHVAIGLLTDSAPTISNTDWIVNWSGGDYFSSWSAPDGLASRTPGTPNTPYTRPITHHDEFSVVANQPCLGGFLYDLLTSNAFLQRDPGTETKITYPVNHQSDFDFLYDLLTSNAFLQRDPGTETKITYPVNHQSDFDFLYDLLTSNAFLQRDPGTETKIEYPVCNDADFSFLYRFVQPPFSILYHLKTTGDDLDDGLSWLTAWATWTHAMQTTPNERTLLVEEGNYVGEAQVEPDNSIVIFLVKNELDAVSTVVVTLV